MEKKNIKWILLGVVIALMIVLVVAVIWMKNKKETPKEEPKEEISYQLTYTDDYEPGSKYEIQVGEKTVFVKTTNYCSALDCEPTTEEEKLEYSKENMQKLKEFIEQLKETTPDLNQLNISNTTPRQRDILLAITRGQYSFEIAIEEYEYLLDYEESDEIGYIVYFQSDGKILVKKTTTKDFDIISLETYELAFTDDNKTILKNFVLGRLDEDSNEVLLTSLLYKDERPYIQSITEKEESYLENMETVPQATYTISYHGVNCITPILRLYSDSTYEYYDTFSSSNQPVEPKSGTYTFDMNTLIANVFISKV